MGAGIVRWYCVLPCSLSLGWVFSYWFSLELDWCSTMIGKRNDILKVDYYG